MLSTKQSGKSMKALAEHKRPCLVLTVAQLQCKALHPQSANDTQEELRRLPITLQASSRGVPQVVFQGQVQLPLHLPQQLRKAMLLRYPPSASALQVNSAICTVMAGV